MSLIKDTIRNIGPKDTATEKMAQRHLDNLTKPLGSLGRLEELARKITGITRSENPQMKNKVIFTMVADHGIVEDGVSAYPQEVTPQMVQNFLQGGAGINVLARHVGIKVVVVDMGMKSDMPPHPGLIIEKINYGTGNFTKGAAMTLQEAERSIESGIKVFRQENNEMKIDIAGTGDMGIGNTTSSSAITAVFTGEKVEKVTGKGTGIDDNTLEHKINMIKKGIKVNRPDPGNALDVLAKVGGFEIGGIAGVILAAAQARIPVVIDGFISGAAALIACGLEPKAKDYLIASHCSVESGHKFILGHLGLKPLFDFELRLGEGTGAALGIDIAEASIKILTEMATFEGAGVSKQKP